MIRMKFEDDKNHRLGLTNNVKIYIDAEKLRLPEGGGNEPAPRLWWLEEKTGRWRDAGAITAVDENDPRRSRRATGRRFLVGEIETDKLSVINIDVPWKRCYVRAEAFTNKSGEREPSDGVTIRMVGQDEEGQFYGYTSRVTGLNGVACLPVWCNSSGYIQAQKTRVVLTKNRDGTRKLAVSLVPDESSLTTLPPETRASVETGKELSSFQFTAAVAGSNGPIYAGDEFNKCMKSDDSTRAFRFFQKTEEEPKVTSPRFPPGHRLAWYKSDGNSQNSGVQKCYAKINIKFIWQPYVMLESFTPDGKEKYGFTVEKFTVSKVVDPRSELAAHMNTTCLEYRCSELNRPTMLRLTIISEFCQIFTMAPKLTDTQKWEKRETELQVEFTASEGRFGKDYGLYTGKDTIAERKCYAANNSGAGSETPSFDGYAVLAYPAWECPYPSENELFP